MYDFDSQLQAAVDLELYNGETLLWVGKPKILRILHKNSLKLATPILLLLVVIVFVPLFAGLPVGFPSEVGFTMVVMLILVGILLFAMLEPVWMTFQQSKALYALTNQRALIIEPSFGGKSIRSYDQVDADNVECREYRNGVGDLIFDHKFEFRTVIGRGSYITGRYLIEIGFFGIANVRDVELLMLETFKMNDSDVAKNKHKNDESYDKERY